MAAISQGFFVKASKSKVFEAISSADGFNNWWTKKCSGNPQAGSEYSFYFSQQYDWKAKVSKFIPNEEIEFTMTDASESWEGTSFGFRLNDENSDLIYVEFFHTNWKTNNKEFQITNYCWANLFFQLKEYLETGIVLPFHERNKHIESC